MVKPLIIAALALAAALPAAELRPTFNVVLVAAYGPASCQIVPAVSCHPGLYVYATPPAGDSVRLTIRFLDASENHVTVTQTVDSGGAATLSVSNGVAGPTTFSNTGGVGASLVVLTDGTFTIQSIAGTLLVHGESVAVPSSEWQKWNN